MSLLLLCVPWVIRTDGYIRDEVGVPGQLSHKVKLKKEGTEEPVNMWVDIPFQVELGPQSDKFLGKPEDGAVFNFLCEKPKGTTLNYKLKTEFPEDEEDEEEHESESWQPVIEIQKVWDDQGVLAPQDLPYNGGLPGNAGIVPQTYSDYHDEDLIHYDVEDYKEAHKHEGKETRDDAIEEMDIGAGGPQDVLVLGEAEPCKIGDVYSVKIIGGFLVKLNASDGSSDNQEGGGGESGVRHWWKLFAVKQGDARQWSDFSDDIAKAKDYYENFEKECQRCGNNTYTVAKLIDAKQAIMVARSLNEKFVETFSLDEESESDYAEDDEDEDGMEM